MSNSLQRKYRSLRSLGWLNFFLADVQTGLGPFLAAYLASNGWHPDRVGFALTFGGLVTVALQTPAGAAIDAVHRKRTLLAVCLGVLVAAAFLLMRNLSAASVYSAQFLIGGVGTFLAPTVTAITLGIVGAGAFDKQFGKNQAFNSAGNVFTALLVAYVSYKFGYRAIFVVSALLAPGARSSRGKRPGAGIVLTPQGPCSSFLPGERFSFSFSQRRDVAATGRDAVEGQPQSRCSVHVRVHHRDAGGDCAHGGLDWKAGCGQRTKTTVAPRLRCPSHTRSSLRHYTFCGGANCDSDSRRRGERRIRDRLHPDYQRQNPRDRPL